MLSRRLARLNEQVREDLAELITRELKDPRIAGLVSVTAVELSPDLRHARIFISVYGTEEQRRQTFAALRSATGFLRSQLAARMTTRRAPEIHFVPDISIAAFLTAASTTKFNTLCRPISRPMREKQMPAGPVNPEGLSGILNVAKPVGMTSHDVVAFIRRQTGQRRVGHAGTLDPAAAGVLLVCLGDATRLSEFLMESDKQYRATIRLGAVSTTDDAEGIITPSASSVDHLALPTITAVLRRFQGEIEQVPPAFSAIKVGGQALYRSARAGQVVQAPSRRVRIDRIEILTWIPPDLTIDVTCSKGTYIRAL